jgi:hypothetical protein
MAFLRSVKAHVQPEAQIHILDTELNYCNAVCLTKDRWAPISSELATIPPDDIVLITDARDVVFRESPWDEIKRRVAQYDLLFFSEGINGADHEWCKNNYTKLQSFTGDVYFSSPELNGGCIAGRAGVLAEFSKTLASLCGIIRKADITDQPILNWHVHRLMRGGWYKIDIVLPESRLYSHGETYAHDPTQTHDPLDSIIFHQFERTPFKDDMLCAIWHPEIVVSHYRENLDWMKDFFPSVKKTVYSKTDGELPKNAIRLENVGFEAHTWLHHFVENYDKLAPATLLLQGKPWDHIEEKLLKKTILSLPEDFSYAPLASEGHSFIETRGVSHCHKELEIFWKMIFNHPPPQRWHNFYGGQFAVSAIAIRSRSKSFWAMLRDAVITKDDACALERMWGHIFSILPQTPL